MKINKLFEEKERSTLAIVAGIMENIQRAIVNC